MRNIIERKSEGIFPLRFKKTTQLTKSKAEKDEMFENPVFFANEAIKTNDFES